MTPAALQREVDALPWFHSIDFGNGVVSKGWIRPAAVRRVERAVFEPLNMGRYGYTVLDVGAWNGAYSIAASLRGSPRVLATDHYVWHEDQKTRAAFDLARRELAPAVEVQDIPVEGINVASVGRFDVVLFLGVFYHLREPLSALRRMAEVANSALVVETRIMQQLNPKPVMEYHPRGRLDGAETNWWTPNPACMKALLYDLGFHRVTFTRPDRRFRRGLFHAWR